MLNIYQKDTSSISHITVTKEKLKLYPNPTKNNFTIDLNLKYDYKIFDINGKIVKTKKNNQGKEKVNCSKFKTGVYILFIETLKYTTTKKILIQ